MARASKPSVFIRESTGLQKNVGFLDAFSMGMGTQAIGAGIGTLGFYMTAFPSISGINLIYASIIAFLFELGVIVVYTIMSTRIPRTGGDYVWLSRSIGGFVACSFALACWVAASFSFNALIALSAVFAVGGVGLFFQPSSSLFFGLAVPGTVPGANVLDQFILGAILFTILLVINIARPKVGFRVLSGLTLIAIVTLLLAIGVLVTAGQPGVKAYINSLNISGTTYDSIAQSNPNPSFDPIATMAMLPFFFGFSYVWLGAGPSVGSEIKGRNALKWNVPAAGMISFLLATATIGAMYYAGGLGFTNAALANPTLVYTYGFNFFTLSMGVANNSLTSLLIGVGWIAWNLLILAMDIIAIARMLLAMAFDRYLPSALAYVSPTLGSPVFAHLVDFVVTVGLIGAAAFLYGTLSALFGTVALQMLYFVLVGGGLAYYGLRREKGTVRTALLIGGTVMALGAAVTDYFFLAYPAVWGINSLSILYGVGSLIASALIYVASKAYHAREGMDISLAFKEIPPE